MSEESSPKLVHPGEGAESVPLLPRDGRSRKPATTLKRVLKFRHGFAFVTGVLIGSGLFVSPGLVVSKSPSLFLALMAWVFGGIIALFGASCYCELASLIRVTGGTALYITKIYGPMAGCAWSWTSLLMVSPIVYSIIITSTGVYVTRMFLEDETSEIFVWSSRAIGLMLFVVLAITNCLGVREFGRAQNLFAICQVLIAGLLISLGIWQVVRQNRVNNIAPGSFMNNTAELLTWGGVQDFGNAMYSALWAYDGWGCVPYLMEEIENPSRNIPLVTFTVIPFVSLVYVFLNLVLMAALTKAEMGSSVSVGVILAEKVSGGKIAFLMPLLVAVCCFGTLNSCIYMNSRVYMTAARERQLPAIFSWIHRERRTPILAIICNVLLTLSWLFLGKGIQAFINYYNVCIWTAYAAVFIGLLITRRSQPAAFRTYKVALVTPVIMAITAILIASIGFVASPAKSVISFAVMVCTLPVYYFLVSKKILNSFYTNSVEPSLIRVLTYCNMVASSLEEPVAK